MSGVSGVSGVSGAGGISLEPAAHECAERAYPAPSTRKEPHHASLHLLAGVAVALGASALPYVASANVPQNVVCRGIIGAIAVDNVEVPDFARCVLSGTTVLGSVEVKPGVRPTASFATVRGSMQATEAVSVVVSDSSITGGFEAVQGGVARSVRNAIGGGLKIEQQSGPWPWPWP